MPKQKFDDEAYPPELRELEDKAIEARREAVNRPDNLRKRIGIGLSGGGIRSATFCLGLFQSLARKKRLSDFDYLSTVSGGGYFGGFLGRLFIRPAEDPTSVEAVLADSQSPEIQWLRENGRYLAPHGSGDILTGTAVLLRNWASVIVVLGVFFLAIFMWLDIALIAWKSLWQSWGTRSSTAASLAAAGHLPAWLSPYVWLPALALLVAVVPLSWAYWMRPPRDSRRATEFAAAPIFVAILVAIVAFLLWWWLPKESAGWRCSAVVWLLIAVVAVLTLVWYVLAILRMRIIARGTTNHANAACDSNADQQALDEDELVTNRLADWLGWSIAVFCGLLAFAAIDTCGMALEQRKLMPWLWGAAAVVGNLIVPFAQKIAAIFGVRPGQTLRLGRFTTLVLDVVGLALAFVLLVLLDALAQAIIHRGAVPSPTHLMLCALAVAAVLLLFSWTSGQTLAFLNRSTPAGIYAARLTRAYLGASNPRRLNNPLHADVTDVVPGDGVSLDKYSPHERGGPLHIINTTINETIDGRSQIEQQDRKGLILAVGPCGVSAGVKHHAEWLEPGRRTLRPLPVKPQPALEAKSAADKQKSFSVFDQGPGVTVEPESLDLGRWLAISGAAFSTGVGSRTCLGLSLIAGLFNVRLGYYWDSGIDPWRRDQKGTSSFVQRVRQWLTGLFPAQMGLIDEFTARFHGTAERLWNLSDGGVFENLAGYELIRRRVPLIVICDAGQDADYAFEDVGNLVRKARTDFAAEITFLEECDLEKLTAKVKKKGRPRLTDVFGSLAQLRRTKPIADVKGKNAPEPPLATLSAKHAALAWVTYANSNKTSLLIYIKPSLTGDESADVIQYAKANPDFPHEPTANQFFDEAQWESYRQLGEHIGERVFSVWNWKMRKTVIALKPQ